MNIGQWQKITVLILFAVFVKQGNQWICQYEPIKPCSDYFFIKNVIHTKTLVFSFLSDKIGWSTIGKSKYNSSSICNIYAYIWYIYIYIHIYVYIHIYIYIYAYIYMHIYNIYIHIYIYTTYIIYVYMGCLWLYVCRHN